MLDSVFSHVRRAVSLIQSGEQESAFSVYAAMVDRLQVQFLEWVEILEKLVRVAHPVVEGVGTTSRNPAHSLLSRLSRHPRRGPF